METKLFCTLKKTSSDYFPTDIGVFTEEDFNIYLLNDGQKIFYCRVPNLTWRANSTGVYWKDTEKNKIFHVGEPRGAPKAICSTKETFWAPCTDGGIFLLEDKSGWLVFHQIPQSIKSTLFKIFSLKDSEAMFEDGSHVVKIGQRLFYPHQNGYFFRHDNSVLYHEIISRKNSYFCGEPKSGGWNAFNGQLLVQEGNDIRFFVKNKTYTFKPQIDVMNFKGNKDGVFIRDRKNNIFFYRKPDWLIGTDSLSEI